MKDGSDAIADWPFINALLNTAAMADLVSIQSNGTMGVSHHTGCTIIADGTEEAALRLDASLTTDVGIGIVRYAQSGYETARAGGGGARGVDLGPHQGAALVVAERNVRAWTRWAGRP